MSGAVSTAPCTVDQPTTLNGSDSGNQDRNLEAPSTIKGQDAEKAAPPKPPGHDAPDGGRSAWLVVFGVWCTSFCSFGWLNSVGVFQEYYESDLLSGYSPSTVSWIPSLQIFFMMVLGPFVGAVYDHFGPRWLLLIGSFLHVFGIVMASISREYYQILLSQGFCSAIGVSAIFQPAITCAAGWFSRSHGTAFGIIFTGSSIGGVVFPIMVSNLIRTIGYGWTMRVCALLLLILLVVANLTIRPYSLPQPQKVTTAQLLKPLKETPFLLLTAGFFLFSYGYYIPINYLPSQAISAGMDSNLAQYLLPILNAGSLFGRLFAGFSGDKFGRYNIFIIVSYLSGIWILALWLPGTGTRPLIGFAALYGCFSGAYVSLIMPLVMQISPMEELGFRSGIVLFVIAVAGLTTNPLNGAMLDSEVGWDGVKIFSGVLCLAGTTFVLATRIKHTGWRIRARF
ncbi:major facilitator superfamily transporter [Xylariales sp. PMI_506]|nr:major facilitator superfamily transporter [Xylariales sp. PMI_506]